VEIQRTYKLSLKILKALHKAKILGAWRGSKGQYCITESKGLGTLALK
jgi:hypothetical protein